MLYHFAVMDLIEDDETLVEEQMVVDYHDDKVLFSTEHFNVSWRTLDSQVHPNLPQSNLISFVEGCAIWRAVLRSVDKAVEPLALDQT